MSSSYPPFGNASARPCQRCGMPLPPNEVYCGNCGQYNTPAQSNNAVAQSSSGMSWGAAPQATYSPHANGSQQWGQPPAQAGQSTPNSPFGGFPVPQQPFGAPGQAYQAYQPQQPSPGNNFYGAPPGQQPNTNNFYATPGQSGGFYGASAPPFHPQSGEFPPGNTNSYPPAGFAQPPSQPVTGGFFPGAANNYSPTGFAQPPSQPVTGGFAPGAMNGYQPAGFAQPPEKKRGPRPAIIIGIIVLLILIIGGSFGGYEYLKKHSTSTNAQVTPTIAPTPVPKGPPLFSDAFTNNKNGWDTVSQSGAYSVKIGNGALALEDDNNKLLWELVPGGRNFKDFFLTTDTVLSKGTQGDGYGIYIRGASNQNIDIATYYRFELYGDGTFAVFKGTVDTSGTSKSSLLVNYTTSSAILKQGQVNHIAISAKGSTISLVVNGQTLTTISDNSYTSGSIALFISNLPNTPPGAQATFSNLVIYPPQS
jgi:Domain of Unknown Function (DUF1080)